MTDCVFCSIIAGKIPGQFVHQDEQVVVFKDIHPKARVHLLV
ncbi:MAG: HIT domain-containing protein, partial [Gammaproteobacteria bacterium]